MLRTVCKGYAYFNRVGLTVVVEKIITRLRTRVRKKSLNFVYFECYEPGSRNENDDMMDTDPNMLRIKL